VRGERIRSSSMYQQAGVFTGLADTAWRQFCDACGNDGGLELDSYGIRFECSVFLSVEYTASAFLLDIDISRVVS